MAIKKKVTYSVSYTAGTDTLATKLNSLLQDIVTLILNHNSGLTVLDTITYGSSRMTGAPLFDGGSGLYAGYYSNRYYQSDVYFIGTNEDNLCLALCFYNGCLVIGMNTTPKVEKAVTDNWAAYGLGSIPKLYAIGRFTRWYPDVDMGRAGNQCNYAIPYTNAGGALSIGVIYWHTEYSSGYEFTTGAGQRDGVNLIIYPTTEGQNMTGLGAAICPFGLLTPARWNGRFWLLTWSFSENVIDNLPETIPGGAEPADATAIQVHCNSAHEMRAWAAGYNNLYGLSWMNFVIWHILGQAVAQPDNLGSYSLVLANTMPQQYTVTKSYNPVSSTSNPEAGTANSGRPLESAYNLPHLNSGQAYVRKMRIPGWNPESKGEIYLLWSPVLYAYKSGDIVEVGSKSYAIITEGAICWAARVS